MGGWNLEESKWANPYKTPRDGTLEEIIAMYEQHLIDSGLINELGGSHRRDALIIVRGIGEHGTDTFADLVEYRTQASNGGRAFRRGLR
jgi:hypothetical protein